jgi:hypothetical protein
MMAFPIVNIVILFLYLQHKYRSHREKREKKQHEQKNPGLVSINILNDIRSKYSDNISNTEDIDFINQLIPIKSKLDSLIEVFLSNYQKPEFARVLSLYELSFSLIKSTIDECEQISDELTNEILLVSKDSIEQVFLEVEQILNIEINQTNNKVIFEKETMEAIKKTFVNRIKEDQEFHSKRTGNSI